MKAKIFGGLIGAMLICLALSACGIMRTSHVGIPLIVSHQRVPRTYNNLDKPVRVVIRSQVSSDGFTPSVQEFTQEATVAYMQQMRFDVSSSADYTLNVDVTTFTLYRFDRKNLGCQVQLTYKFVNEAGETLIPSSKVSSEITFAPDEQFGNGFGRAYADALSKVNWDRIAEYLTVVKPPKKRKTLRSPVPAIRHWSTP